MGTVLAIRLEKRIDLGEVLEPARVVEQMAYRHAALDRADLRVERQRPLVDELEHNGGREELRHARDPKAMVGRHRRSGREVGDARRLLPGRTAVGRQNDSAWSAFLQHRVQVIVECPHEAILGFL
jgi:hypothetical protein